ncbi:Tn3 family transposase [Streptomyces sp. HYC2]|uniref:Tn3 family transposase n=1 Tax=Streptomyces sp. HYC2 TaxID=2955207 RepID=UPI00247FAD73|nr:Tn3 family transposase [Streptomyces sp. HYC2]
MDELVESWNAADAVIYYGKGGEISTNWREEVEMAALCLRILQASLVYVNTLTLQDILTEPAWADLGAADRRGLTPLFWNRVRPYGEARLDLSSRLALGTQQPGEPPSPTITDEKGSIDARGPDDSSSGHDRRDDHRGCHDHQRLGDCPRPDRAAIPAPWPFLAGDRGPAGPKRCPGDTR